jgi:hypothetical protein
VTPREKALLLRLAAIEETQEWGAHNLRRTLRDLGWTDEAMDAAVVLVRRVLAGVVLTQTTF